jgi:hypothetical protein
MLFEFGFFSAPLTILIHFLRLGYEYANAGDLLNANGAYGNKVERESLIPSLLVD